MSLCVCVCVRERCKSKYSDAGGVNRGSPSGGRGRGVRGDSRLGRDDFYLIGCYRNIYPGSLDVFMGFGCVHTRRFMSVQHRVALMPGPVSRFEVFVVLGGGYLLWHRDRV